MPIGIKRYNDHGRHPNDRIGFITPLKGPDQAIARDILYRIAAKVAPIMKQHGMDVMSLEEFEPNREFVGRNWNAGENIELVLKSLNGQWLPLRWIQDVMLHELSHIRSMSHGPLFWKTYHTLKKEMTALDAKGYTGEGFYSRGYSLASAVSLNRPIQEDEVPANLCGGTWQRQIRRRKKNRVRKRKFMGEGVKIGEDEAKRRQLEHGKVTNSKSRVAKSKRGRELRAEAASRRIGIQQAAEQSKQESESDTESEDEIIKSVAFRRNLTGSIKPEDDDEEAKRQMNEEMKTLLCGTAGDPIDFSYTTFEESDNTILNQPPKSPVASRTASDGPSFGNDGFTCRICTTHHSPPLPVCCESCSNVLEPEKLALDRKWVCRAPGCAGMEVEFVNYIDAGSCALCGTKRTNHIQL